MNIVSISRIARYPLSDTADQLIAEFEKATIVTNLKEELLGEYIDKRVMPDVPAQAARYTFDFQSFVDLLLPRMSTKIFNSDIHGVKSSLQPDGPAAADGKEMLTPADAPGQDRFFQEDPARIKFRSSLIDIFTQAMTWRAGKLKLLHEDYEFQFPCFGDAFETEQVRRTYGAAKDPDDRAVVLGLLPIVRRRIREKVLGQFGEEQVVGFGVVV